jgi:hypothetical protein
MQRTRCVFTLGSNGKDSTHESAHHLADVLYPKASIAIVDISSREGCFRHLKDEDVEELFFIGHGNTGTYAGYSAKQFAHAVSAQFLKNRKADQKNKVEDIFLLGCDVGLIKKNHGNSLAQDIANALKKEGFKKAKIHCIAKPENSKDDELIVEVIHSVNANGLAARSETLARVSAGKSVVQPGFINAILRGKGGSDLKFIDGAHPRTELSKPQHTFIADEKPKDRKDRIDTAIASHQLRKHAEALSLLERRRLYLKKKQAQTKNPKDKLSFKLKARGLKLTITTLKTADDTNWLILLTKAIGFLESHLIYKPIFNTNSNTMKLLKGLKAENEEKVHDIVAQQVENERVLKVPVTLANPQPLAEKKVELHFVSSPTPPPAAEKNVHFADDIVAAVLASPVAIRKELRFSEPADRHATTSTTVAVISHALRSQIDQAYAILEAEKNSIKGSCFFFFRRSQYEVKLQKLQKLNDLRDPQISLGAACIIAEAALKRHNITRGWRSRTEQILHKVISEQQSVQSAANPATPTVRIN